MDKIIIYKEKDNAVAIMRPSSICLETYTIQQIAEKDVPPGKPFKIVNEDQIPWNWPQETWDIDNSLLTDGVGNQTNQFEEKK